MKDRKGWYSSYFQVDSERGSNLLPSMFPSGRQNPNFPLNPPKNEEISTLNPAENPPENGSKSKVLGETEGEENGGKQGEIEGKEGELKGEECPFPMEKCLRLAPHDMDTGGFFIALLKKVKPLTGRILRSFLYFFNAVLA